MEEERAAAEAAAEEGQDENGGKQGKTWYPYITKVQFEKFLSRLESKVPEQIDRDYVRAIIRTPSMIYRFLRGIEAMGLIDRDQHLTPRLTRLISKETRKFALAEVIRELYKELLPEWEQTDGNMSDDAVVDYFRDRTGMGRDSANKMKMFFKYLIGEADFGEPPEGIETVEPEAKAAPAPAPEPAPEPAPAPAPAPARSRAPASRERGGRSGRGNREERSSREERSEPSGRSESSGRSEPSGRPEPSERPDRSSRPLTETQKAYLDTVQSVVQIKIDGDWDEDMIRVAFDRLERLFDRIRRV